MQIEQIGKYRVVAKIGQGAMGDVYKGHDPTLNRDVAIKTITASLGAEDDIRKRVLREAQSAARLNHPNIITVYDYGEEQGKIYMAMELLEGRDLKDLIAQNKLGDLHQKPSPTPTTSSIATSSPRTSTSSRRARSRSSTSASRASARPR